MPHVVVYGGAVETREMQEMQEARGLLLEVVEQLVVPIRGFMQLGMHQDTIKPLIHLRTTLSKLTQQLQLPLIKRGTFFARSKQ